MAASPEEYWNKEDAQDVALEVAEFLRVNLDIAAIERDLTARSQVDATTLGEVTDWFAAVDAESPKPYGMQFPDGTDFDWSVPMERLRQLVAGLTNPEQLEELEIALRISFMGDPAFSRMLMALAPDHPLRAKLERKLVEKLGLLGDDQAMEVWAGLRGEIDPSRPYSLAIEPTVVAPGFFDLGDAATARGKIAYYLACVQPLRIRKSFDRGVTDVPAGHTGIMTILCWKEHPSTRTSKRKAAVQIEPTSGGSAILAVHRIGAETDRSARAAPKPRRGGPRRSRQPARKKRTRH